MVHQSTIEKCDALVARLAELSSTENKKMSKEKLKKLGVQITKAMFKDGLLLQRIAASSHPLSKKAKMLYISKVPITDTKFKAELEEIATLSLTGKQEIKNLVFKNNVVVGDGTKKTKKIPSAYFNDARKHILSFSELSDEPMLLSTVFKRYVSSKPKEMFFEVFRKVAQEVLGSSELQKKAKFCFVYGVQISSKFLKDLEDSGVEVEVNRKNQIEYLKFEDGKEYHGEPPMPNGKTGVVMDSEDSKESKIGDVEVFDSGDEEDIEDSEVVNKPKSDSVSRPVSRASSTASSIRNLPGYSDSEDDMDSDFGVSSKSKLESKNTIGSALESQDMFDFDYVPRDLDVVQTHAPESQMLHDHDYATRAPAPEYTVKSGPITLDDVILASEDVHWTPDGVVISAPSLKRAQEDYVRAPESQILHDHDYASRAPEVIPTPKFLAESGPITLEDVILPSEDVQWTPDGVVRSAPNLKRARQDDTATAPKAPKHMKYN